MNKFLKDNIEYNSSDILTPQEKNKFKNFHLPMFVCPSCWTISKWKQINMIASSCVNCGDKIELKEFKLSSLKQFQKKDFAFKLDINDAKHQEIIALFRDNVLWQCNSCNWNNLNLPKDKNWDPDISHDVHCDWCGDKYIHWENLLPFWALKWFWFDDWDDSNNTYELEKLWETQLLWLQAIEKAHSIDATTNNWKRLEIKKLQDWLETLKSNTRTISRGRRKDGTKALEYLENYLYWESYALNSAIQRKTTEYVRTVLETNNPFYETPKEKTIIKDYTQNLKYLDLKTWLYTWTWVAFMFLALTSIIDWKYEIEIRWTKHSVSYLKESKWTLDLEYNIQKHTPYYDDFKFSFTDEWNISYNTTTDNTWKELYNKYASKKEYYRLQMVWEPVEIKKWTLELDTWRDETIHHYVSCPETSDYSSDTSWWWSWWGWWGGWWWSSGMWFWWSGDLMLWPKWEEIQNHTITPAGEYNPTIQLASLTGEKIFQIITMTSDAHADDCWYDTTEDITIEADIKYTIQKYKVRDWKTKQWFESEIKEGIDYHSTYSNLKEKILRDIENERIIDQKLKMILEIKDENWKIIPIPILDEAMWKQLNNAMEKRCTISKPLLFKWINGITDDDLKQCNIEK